MFAVVVAGEFDYVRVMQQCSRDSCISSRPLLSRECRARQRRALKVVPFQSANDHFVQSYHDCYCRPQQCWLRTALVRVGPFFT